MWGQFYSIMYRVSLTVHRYYVLTVLQSADTVDEALVYICYRDDCISSIAVVV